MSEARDMLVATAERLFQDYCTPELLKASNKGPLSPKLWSALTDAGLTAALVSERAGGAGVDLADGLALLIEAGRFSVPAPLAETMIAGWLLDRAGLPVPQGVLTFAISGANESVSVKRAGENVHLSGKLARLPWAKDAAGLVVLLAEGDKPIIAYAPRDEYRATGRHNLAGEPRDDVELASARVEAAPSDLNVEDWCALGAIARSAQMAGAMQRLLALSVQYAQERVQFGRPIGKFQAIQQSLAALAGQAAAATAAADGAIEAAPRDLRSPLIAAAKIRCGEAAGIGAAIAHQVHGAIGFTQEHSLHYTTRRLWSWRDEFGNEAEWSAMLGTRAAKAGADQLWSMITAA
ncbi:MAG: acyl-CoA/acyl-ACP dehydrogenase [Methylobacteriaceae bacterium]|nr:acyl-CoA/acyl-ACP dehydrogenase [Methylobacteriaceae bacterium]MBV9393098.1 acyl-CoA/acyl-ACP dehydrogenase [Methylobacteriaceae bacterium]